MNQQRENPPTTGRVFNDYNSPELFGDGADERAKRGQKRLPQINRKNAS